ncbi:MAG TPA: hypothetical protein ENJ29_15130 [Bacteroidetes bacterium]|nr:hypothetical protein [Bacteroidota bacterium]
MRLHNFCAAGLLFAAACSPVHDKEASMKSSNKEKVIALLRSIETDDPHPVSFINPDRYIQHNLMVGDGIAGFAAVLQQLPKGSARVKIIRAFEDGDYVFTHTEYDFFGPKIGFDIFRFENGLIVEHWDNLQETAPANSSGRTQTDGPVNAVDLHKTAENKALVQRFIEEVLVAGKAEEITQYISPASYQQHNPALGDGLEALADALQRMAAAGTPMTYTRNHMILGEGNFVLAVSEGTFLGKHVAFYDLFRIENGKLAEHWDTIEEIPAREAWKNDNGKF